jgi:hypothetical protein
MKLHNYQTLYYKVVLINTIHHGTGKENSKISQSDTK